MTGLHTAARRSYPTAWATATSMPGSAAPDVEVPLVVGIGEQRERDATRHQRSCDAPLGCRRRRVCCLSAAGAGASCCRAARPTVIE